MVQAAKKKYYFIFIVWTFSHKQLVTLCGLSTTSVLEGSAFLPKTSAWKDTDAGHLSAKLHRRGNGESLSNDLFVSRNLPTEKTPALDTEVLRTVTRRRKGTEPSNVMDHWFMGSFELISAKIFQGPVLTWHSAVVQHSALSPLQDGTSPTLSGIYFFIF